MIDESQSPRQRLTAACTVPQTTRHGDAERSAAMQSVRFDHNEMMCAHSRLFARQFGFALFFCLCTTTGCHSPTSSNDKTALSSTQNENLHFPRPGQIEVQFKEFQQAKDLLAVFELANNTNLPILYESYSFTDNSEKANFCQLAVKQSAEVMQGSVSNCKYANNIALLILESGERVSFAVPKWEVKMLLNLTSDKPEIMTKIGFEVFVGEKRQKRIVWSEMIRYPQTL